MMKIYALLFALIGLAVAAPGGRITGGSDATRGQFPYQVSMQWGIIGVWQHICGGSIIANNLILTAGHCVTETPGLGSFRIRAGILNINEASSAGQTISVASTSVHPDYEGGVNPNDLAILRLSSALSFTDEIQPIALPAANAIATGQSVLSGWGSTSTTSTAVMPTTLQTATLPLLTFAECDAALTAIMGTSDPLVDTNVCTGPLTGGYSACSGDSGGPLAQNGEIIGVVSWGIMPCGSVGAPSVYVQVSNFVTWINSHE